MSQDRAETLVDLAVMQISDALDLLRQAGDELEEGDPLAERLVDAEGAVEAAAAEVEAVLRRLRQRTWYAGGYGPDLVLDHDDGGAVGPACRSGRCGR